MNSLSHDELNLYEVTLIIAKKVNDEYNDAHFMVLYSHGQQDPKNVTFN